ncbi:MAG: hypothetical protein QOE81_484, partial [Verrucomicrobiota bacterium]
MHRKVKSRSRRAIPAVNKVLDSLGPIDLPRPLIVDLVREELAKLRRQRQISEFSTIVDLVRASIEKLRASRIQPV